MNFSALNWFDYLLVAVLGLSILFGLFRGFVKEIIAIMTWIAAFLVAILFTHDVANYIGHYFKTPVVAIIVGFIGLFIATFIVGSLINVSVSAITKGCGLGIPNRILGGIFGFFRGFLVVLLIVFVIENVGFATQPWVKSSQLTQQFQGVSQWISQQITQATQSTSQTQGDTQQKPAKQDNNQQIAKN